MSDKITIYLREPHGQPVQIPAVVFGDWAAHGVVHLGDETSTPSTTDFTVTHIPTGLCIASHTGFRTQVCAEAIARTLADEAPSPTKEDAERQRDRIVAIVRDIRERYEQSEFLWGEP